MMFHDTYLKCLILMISAGACEMPDITDGYVLSLQTPFTVGKTVTVLCDLGYVISGSSEITCQFDSGTIDWSPAVPTCGRKYASQTCP